MYEISIRQPNGLIHHTYDNVLTSFFQGPILTMQVNDSYVSFNLPSGWEAVAIEIKT